MRMHKKMILGLTAASALSVGVIGGIVAQTPGDDPEIETAHAGPRHAAGQKRETIADILGTDAESIRAALAAGGTLANAATAAGVEPQVLIDALVAEASARVDEERAAEYLANVEARITTTVNEGRPARGEGEWTNCRRHHRGAMRLVAQAANVIGVEPQEVAEALQGGASLAEFGAANGVSEELLIGAILAELSVRLDEAVANERITQEQADGKLSNMAERLTEAVNKVRDGSSAEVTATTI